MASLNVLERITTHEGAPAPRISPLAQLERSVMSCMLWESEFYESGQSIGQRIADLVKAVDPADVARVAIRAKEDMRLRHVPLLLVRELMRSAEGRKLASQVFPKIVTRPDDITEFLAIYWKDNKDEPIAKQVKRHLGAAFGRFDEYQIAKYNGGQKAVKLRDAIRILRPRPANEDQSALWRRLVKGELATPDTWEVELSRSKDKAVSWSRLLSEGKLGGLAMLRNIRNMAQAGIDPPAIRDGIRSVNPGRLMPINFIAAARANPQFEPDLEAKFFECFAGREKLKGETILLVDISYSMNAALSGRSDLTRSDAAAGLAMIARETFENLRVFVFGDSVREVPARRGFALGGLVGFQRENTYLGRALGSIPARDRLIVITDEQSHDPVPQMKGYMVNVASSQNGVGYGAWTHIDGWSDRILDYIARHEASQVD